MIFLWNPSKDALDYTYGGLSFTIPAGTRKKVKEPEGNHALNAIGSRGLTKLVFDDDGKSINEEKIEADAIERNREFKVRQIVHYNERNERRKASGQPYDPPTQEVKKYAAELGIELLKGYDMAVAEKAQIAKVTEENDSFKKQLEAMNATNEAMMDMIKKLQDQIADGFVKSNSKVVQPTDMIKCDICGEMVMAKSMKSHMNYRHKEGNQ
jgi:hypothetical protein